MATCGIKEKGKPKCLHELDKKGLCPVHCRARTRSCDKCKRRYTKEERELIACPECKNPRWCKRHHCKGRVRCQKHGGASPAGLASPHLKTGNGSRYLNALSGDLRDRYLEVQKNPDLLSLSPDIYLLDARLEEVIGRVNGGGSGTLWRHALQMFQEFATAQANKDRESSINALSRLSALLREGVADYAAWDEVKDLWRHRARLVESERKRALESKGMMATDYFMFLAGEYVAALKRHVTNQDILRAIQRDVERRTAGQGALPQFIDAKSVQRR